MAGREFLVRQAQIAAQLGHELEVYHRRPERPSWRARCSCGWESTDRRTQAVALGAGFHHAGLVVGASRRDGATTPVVARDTPKIVGVPASVPARL